MFQFYFILTAILFCGIMHSNPTGSGFFKRNLFSAVYLIFYKTASIPVKMKRTALRPNRNIAARLYSIGISATLNLALPSLLISVLNGILAEFSDKYVLVLGVYYKLQTFIYLTANGIIQGIRPLMGLFTNQSETLANGVTALRIISLGFVISAVSVTCSGSLEGLGKGVPSLCISLLRYIVIIMPLSFLLSRALEAEGVWWAFCITEFITAGISYFIYCKNETLPVPGNSDLQRSAES